MGSRIQSITEFRTKKARASLTRPADTTAYTAGDVVSAVTTNDHYTFEGAVVKGRGRLSGALSSAICYTSANVATKPDLELWVFDTDIAEVADNGAFAPTDAELLTLIGVVSFPTGDFLVGTATAGAGGNAVCLVENIGIAFQAASTSLYGQLVMRNAYVPVSGEVFTVDLLITQD